MKLQINKYYFILCILFAVFFDYRQLFLFFIAIILHEASHIFFSKIFSIKIKSIDITAFGLIADTYDINRLSLMKRLIITSSGFMANLLIFLVIHFYGKNGYYLTYFKYVNLILFIFNILPIYPLVLLIKKIKLDLKIFIPIFI